MDVRCIDYTCKSEYTPSGVALNIGPDAGQWDL